PTPHRRPGPPVRRRAKESEDPLTKAADGVRHQVRRQRRLLTALGRGIVRLPLRTLGLADATSHRRRSIGQAPGTLPELSAEERVPVRIDVLRYDGTAVEEFDDVGVAEAAAQRDGPGVVWIDVVGVRDPDAIRALGEA